jgi:protein-disulfide isomerase
MADTEQQDPTRKERREQARAERRAAEEAHAADAARRNRLIQLGAVAGVVVVAIVVIVVATSGSGGANHISKTGSKAANKNVAEIQSLIGNIPQRGDTLGASTAPVTLVYFGDLECPICREFTEGALPSVIKKWVRPGKLRIEYRSLQTATREPETFRNQQVAALAAGKQNKMWDFIELFYKEQGEEGTEYVTEEYLHKLASAIPGLDLSKWSSARQDTQLASQVEEDGQTANQQGFNGTPSFLIGHSGGALQKLEPGSLTSPSGFDKAIEQLV